MKDKQLSQLQSNNVPATEMMHGGPKILLVKKHEQTLSSYIISLETILK